MFFRPSFCANCGEKVERSDWGPFTSRRFCAVCESELKAHDLIPRVIVGLGLLVGIFGIGSYLKSGNAEPRLAELTAPIERPVAAAVRESLPANVIAATPAPVQTAPASNAIPQAKSTGSVPLARQVAQNAGPDVVYMCGAMTKKGTPCSRRVHGPVRCFQHQGMPPMVPQEKLKIG
jgi:hypothetical protein